MAGMDFEAAVTEGNKVEEEKQKKREEAKKKADEKKKIQKEKEEKEALERKERVIFTAQEILGDYLVRKFADHIKEYPNTEAFYRKFAPFLLKFEHTSYYNNNREQTRGVKIGYIDSISRAFVGKLCSKLAGGYAASTDWLAPIKKQNQKPDPETLKSSDFNLLFPEYFAMQKIPGQMPYSEPYDHVMKLSFDRRPLIAVATKKFYDKNPAPQDNQYTPSSRLPDLETLMETAKEFEITDVREAIAELNSLFES